MACGWVFGHFCLRTVRGSVVAGPFGIDAAFAATRDGRVDEGLRALASPPDWLSAMEDPDRMRSDLERCIPELASGSVTLAACKFKAPTSKPAPGRRFTVSRSTTTRASAAKSTCAGGSCCPGPTSPPAHRRTRLRHGGLAVLPAGCPLGPRHATHRRGTGRAPLLTDPGRSRTLLERSLRECATDLTDLQLAATVHTDGDALPGGAALHHPLRPGVSAGATTSTLAVQRRRQGLRRRRGSRHLRRHVRALGPPLRDEHGGDDRRAHSNPSPT